MGNCQSPEINFAQGRYPTPATRGGRQSNLSRLPIVRVDMFLAFPQGWRGGKQPPRRVRRRFGLPRSGLLVRLTITILRHSEQTRCAPLGEVMSVPFPQYGQRSPGLAVPSSAFTVITVLRFMYEPALSMSQAVHLKNSAADRRTVSLNGLQSPLTISAPSFGAVRGTAWADSCPAGHRWPYLLPRVADQDFTILPSRTISS